MPFASLTDRLWSGLRSLVRLVSNHAPAPPAAEGSAPAARRRVSEWLAKYEAAAHELTSADQGRRTLIDSYVATPEDAVEQLMEVARTFGRVPLHPLLARGDVPLAERFFKSLTERPERLEMLRQAPEVVAPEARARLAEALHREVVEPPRAVAPRMPTLPLTPEQSEHARGLATRVLGARQQVLAAVDRTRREMAGARTVAERDAARDVGGQVLYAEVAGKRALLEAQKIPSGTSRVIDVALSPTEGAVRRVLVDGAADLVRVEPVRMVADQDVMRWRKTLTESKSRIAEARVGLVKVEHATPIQKLELDRDALGRRVTGIADAIAAGTVIATPEVRRHVETIRDLPLLKADAARYLVLDREYPSGRSPAPDAVREARGLTAQLQPIIQQKEQAAAALVLSDPKIGRDVAEWRRLDTRYTAEQLKLADDPTARAQEIKRIDTVRPFLTRGMQDVALKTLPAPEDVSRDLSPRIVDTRVAPAPGRERMPATPPASVVPAAPPAQPGRIVVPDAPLARGRAPLTVAPPGGGPAGRAGLPALPALPSPGPSAPKVPWEQVAQYVHQEEEAWRKRQGQFAPAGGEAYNRRVAEEKVFQEELRQRVARMTGGNPNWQEIRKNIAGKVNYGTSAYGAVYSRDQLNDPAFLKQMYQARMGGWGVVHQFKDADEYKKFIESRLAGYGIVHKTSDLQAGSTPSRTRTTTATSSRAGSADSGAPTTATTWPTSAGRPTRSRISSRPRRSTRRSRSRATRTTRRGCSRRIRASSPGTPTGSSAARPRPRRTPICARSGSPAASGSRIPSPASSTRRGRRKASSSSRRSASARRRRSRSRWATAGRFGWTSRAPRASTTSSATSSARRASPATST
ncbi:MAG: hypothetical protein HYV94_08470, partial [Candidatus Rokubacteria bacterium]|nr:hypothetical protein [Candidatus Rokubacteria bacterium]